MKKAFLTICLMSMATGAALAAPNAQDLPGIPLQAVAPIEEMPMREITLKPRFSADNSANAATGEKKAKKEYPDDSLYDNTSVALNVLPGENAILPVSQGHPNRLITPFGSPRIYTASDAQIEVDHNIIYITPSDRNAVTMFVTEADGNQEKALSLTLVPRAIPPREVRLLVSGDIQLGSGYVSTKAENWEKGQEYSQVLLETMKTLALGKVPQGFGLRPPVPSDPQISCQMPGVEITPGQAMDGHNTIVMIAKAKNTSKKVIEIQEPLCYTQNVLAVSSWPYVRLAPDQSTELYVIFRRTQPEERAAVRPSLLSKEVSNGK